MKIFANCGCFWQKSQKLVAAEKYDTVKEIKVALKELGCNEIREVLKMSVVDNGETAFNIVVVYKSTRLEFEITHPDNCVKVACVTCGTCMGQRHGVHMNRLLRIIEGHYNTKMDTVRAKEICGKK